MISHPCLSLSLPSLVHMVCGRVLQQPSGPTDIPLAPRRTLRSAAAHTPPPPPTPPLSAHEALSA